MIGKIVGRSPGLLELRRLVVHADRVELASAGLFGLDVRRVSFDDLTCATVQRCLPPWTEIALTVTLALLALILGGLGAWQPSPWLLVPAGLAGLGVVALTSAVWLAPPHLLVVHTADHSLRARLPRAAAAREAALAFFVRSVESHQGQRAGATVAQAKPAADA